ncbi:ABC transporter ATP-binding protein [Rhizobium sp. SSA_523]|uniref:ABC transporter ATP-binding protein n=1 Tax=Rhizobium sp. SSA_523 TaxID=2952477 RepID=UPI00209103C2|nr:ABC transporter ATP-binding protein [Rhizobium sp. SSA_523]MCO5731257.1 ABC transporter ATP-binding protein/permease [Rhizobium sp. SSA_523]WKC22205.1 ABC transporter ATP-binding protein [Rhizobium sp. SSA_523]
MLNAIRARVAAIPIVRTYTHLCRHAGKEASALRQSLFDLCLSAVFQGLAFAALAPLLASLVTGENGHAPLAWLAIFGCATVIATLLRWRAQGFDFGGSMTRCGHKLRLSLGESLRRMPQKAISDHRSGDVTATLLGGIDEIFGFALTLANLLASALITPIIAYLALCAFDWRLGLALLSIVPLVLVLYHWQRPALDASRLRLGLAQAGLNAAILDYLQALPAYRSACLEGDKAEGLRGQFRQMENLQRQEHRKTGTGNMLVVILVEMSLFCVLALCLTRQGADGSDMAIFAAAAVMTARFMEPLGTVVSFTTLLSMMDAALTEIDAITTVEPLPQWLPQAVPLRHDIAVSDVTFRYDRTRPPVLTGVTAQIPEGSFTALVGSSGSGKTSFIRLLQRQDDPEQGKISIGGVDLRQIPQDRLAGMIGCVFQDVYLFNDTVWENICLARPDATRAQVIRAAEAAGCLEFIDNLPDGWQTRLDERAARLSGGERQRLSIARAFLKDAPILVLDEPTAALDLESERDVQQALDGLVRQRTVIVIAHRLHTIARADQILVLERGCVAECGTHAALLAEKGRYFALWQAEARARHWRFPGEGSDGS